MSSFFRVFRIKEHDVSEMDTLAQLLSPTGLYFICDPQWLNLLRGGQLSVKAQHFEERVNSKAQQGGIQNNMNLEELGKNWDKFAQIDALGAICVSGPSWKKRKRLTVEEFFESGVLTVTNLMTKIESNEIYFRRQRALDFGCGVGRLTLPLGGYFEEVCGVDISDR